MMAVSHWEQKAGPGAVRSRRFAVILTSMNFPLSAAPELHTHSHTQSFYPEPDILWFGISLWPVQGTVLSAPSQLLESLLTAEHGRLKSPWSRSALQSNN